MFFSICKEKNAKCLQQLSLAINQTIDFSGNICDIAQWSFSGEYLKATDPESLATSSIQSRICWLDFE